MISKERLGIAIVFGASIAALFMRLMYLGYKSVWLDEAVSAYAASLRIVDILIYASRADYHPPLYYLILHMIPINKYNEFNLRLPSAVAGALTVPASYYLGKVAFNQKVGIITACLVAVFSLSHLPVARSPYVPAALSPHHSLIRVLASIIEVELKSGLGVIFHLNRSCALHSLLRFLGHFHPDYLRRLPAYCTKGHNFQLLEDHHRCSNTVRSMGSICGFFNVEGVG